MEATTTARSDFNWWEGEDKHLRLWDTIERIRRAQDYRYLNNLLHASLYGNVALSGFAPNNYGRTPAGAHTRLSLNVVKNMVAAVTSKIAAKNKVRSTFLTQGGDYSLKRKARQLEKLVAGVFYDIEFYRKQVSVFRNGCIFGTGAIKITADHEQKCVRGDKIPTWEIFTDDAESLYGEPRSLFHRPYYDRRVAMALWPEAKDEIRRAQIMADDVSLPDATGDYIPIAEAWRLPSKPGADDGRRVVAIGNATLVDEPWTKNTFPFAFFRWSEDPDGFFGVGLAYELAGIQAEINDLLLEIQRAHRYIKGHWAVEHGSKVILSHLNDDLTAIVKYAGTMPQYYAPVAIAQDVYSHLWNLYQKASEISGISQLMAQSQKPAGLNSGVALRAYDDIQTERFLEVGVRLEDFTMDSTKLVIDAARELSEAGGFKVNARSKNMIERIDFADVDMKKDEYVLQVFPTSLLPTQPAGRIAFVQDMINAKMISPEDGFELIDMPDTEGYAARKSAKRRLFERNMEEIIEHGRWVPPEPNDDHQFALAELPGVYAQARLDAVPPESLELLRRYEVLSVRLDAAKQAAAAAPPPPAGAPPGAPQPNPAPPPAPMEQAA